MDTIVLVTREPVAVLVLRGFENTPRKRLRRESKAAVTNGLNRAQYGVGAGGAADADGKDDRTLRDIKSFALVRKVTGSLVLGKRPNQ